MRLSALWLKGLVSRRWGRMLATSGGIAMAVALLASIGSFLTASQATMTTRSVATVAVDWQVEAQAGADPEAVLNTVRAQPHVTSALPVDLVTIPGLSATTGGTTQATGQAVVVGLPDRYAPTFPGEIRALIGSPGDVAVSQQTAANLNVRPGDVLSIERPGTSPSPVTLAAVVDLPQADSLFQKVGAPAGSQLSAPPDNVLLLPANLWHGVFDGGSAASANPPRHQIHVRLDRALPAAPATAFDQVSGAARNLESKLAGTGLVGNNLAATLGTARGDAAYATVMFLFLGVPGAALAGLLTAVVAAAGASRRRREQALLRSRGASTSTLMRIALLEAGLAGFLGSLLGLTAAFLIGALAFGSPGFGADALHAAIWAGAAAAAGLVIAVLVIAVPARRHALQTTVAGARLGRRRPSDDAPSHSSRPWARVRANWPRSCGVRRDSFSSVGSLSAPSWAGPCRKCWSQCSPGSSTHRPPHSPSPGCI